MNAHASITLNNMIDATEWYNDRTGECVRECVARFTTDWDYEPVGADDVGSCREYATMQDLIIVDEAGAEYSIHRAEALRRFTCQDIEVLEFYGEQQLCGNGYEHE